MAVCVAPQTAQALALQQRDFQTQSEATFQRLADTEQLVAHVRKGLQTTFS